jgi:xanthine permease XanP
VISQGDRPSSAVGGGPDVPDLWCGLEDQPPLRDTLLVAIQHVLAMFVGIITPPLIVGGALKLTAADTAYLVSMSLLVSGIGTLLQTSRLGPVGSGLLSVQGTSFTFISPILAATGAVIGAGGGAHAALGVAFGLAAAGAPLVMLLSRFIQHASRLITPLVTGTVVLLIGLTLLQVGATNAGGGFDARANGSFGSLENLGLAALVMLVVLVFNSCRSRHLRMLSVILGLAAGYAAGALLGRVDFALVRAAPGLVVPIPFKFGLGMQAAALIPFAFTYLISAIESVGDLTATSTLSGLPIHGPQFMQLLRGGLLADGINSAIGACLGSFPATTFAQNNGVIQLTGVGSRYVGRYIGAMLALLGLIPAVGAVVQAMPAAALGGATLIMFGMVAAAGIRILARVPANRRNALILAVSIGLGLGVTFVPELLGQLPPLLRNTLSSGIATGGLCALVLNTILPGNESTRAGN